MQANWSDWLVALKDLVNEVLHLFNLEFNIRFLYIFFFASTREENQPFEQSVFNEQNLWFISGTVIGSSPSLNCIWIRSSGILKRYQMENTASYKDESYISWVSEFYIDESTFYFILIRAYFRLYHWHPRSRDFGVVRKFNDLEKKRKKRKQFGQHDPMNCAWRMQFQPIGNLSTCNTCVRQCNARLINMQTLFVYGTFWNVCHRTTESLNFLFFFQFFFLYSFISSLI